MLPFDALAAEAINRTLVMGILNLTPDSFYDGGKYGSLEEARARALKLREDGADILDLGGQSTRPGAAAVGPDEELSRVLPLARFLKQEMPGVPWSIDTQRVEVAKAALDLGACMVNDVSALRGDPGMAALVAGRECGLCLMHWPEPSETLAVSTKETRGYGPGGVVEAAKNWLLEKAQIAEGAGVKKERIWLDPGFGFGKTVPDNLGLCKGVERFVATGYGVLLGTSRKSTLGAVLGNLPPTERLEATLATTALAAWMGAACVRVHDARENVRVVRTIMAIKEAK